MNSKRGARINNEFKREIGEIIQTELKDPIFENTMVSVLRADVTRDLSHANIHLSVLGSDKQQENILAAIERATGFIKRELGQRVAIRRIPELHFILDRSIEYAIDMSKKIDDVVGKDKK